MNKFCLLILIILLATVCSACHKSSSSESARHTATLEELAVPVQLLQLNKKMDLPGQMLAYQDVPVHAKVEGFISWIGVDRGWVVKKGQKMISIYCPELEAKYRESISKLGATKSAYEQSLSSLASERAHLTEAQAKL